MAQKRAFVGATLLATGASEFFTQDIEDMEIDGKFYSEQSGFEDIAHEEIKIKVPTQPTIEELDAAIKALGLCETKDQLTQVKKDQPDYIIKHKDFQDAGKARYKEIVK